jgi:hypothetical protein
MRLVSFAEFARQQNIDKSMVTKLKRQGVLDAALVDPEPGKKRPRLDLKKAIAAYKKNTDPAFRKGAPTIKKKKGGSNGAGSKKSGGDSFVQARTHAEQIKAKDRELTYLIRQKKYIEVKLVNARAYTAGRVLRDNLLNIPIRAAAAIRPGTKKKEKQIYQLLRREIIKVLKECNAELSNLCQD